nr:isoform 2 of nudix hydrolase 15, mitochondrial [Quercus suber]
MAYLVTQPCLTEEVWGSQTLQRLVKQLQYFNQLTRANEEIEKDCCGIGSDFGLFKSPEVKNDLSSCVNWRERRAVVLICLFEGQDGELQVILTKRSMKLSSHQGDVALLGGKVEKVDADDFATAIREANVEIGLEPNLVQVVATLETFISQVYLLGKEISDLHSILMKLMLFSMFYWRCFSWKIIIDVKKGGGWVRN